MVALSRLEVAVLVSLAGRDGPSHAASLLPEVEERLGGGVNRGALARALASLETRRLVRGRSIGPEAHGGPSRIAYKIIREGRDALASHVRSHVRVMQGASLSPLAMAFLRNPPEGTKTAEAKRFGIDLGLLVQSARQSPADRYREAIATLRVAEKYARR